MKANKKTLMAVKRYIEEPEGYNMDEVISDLVYETEKLKDADGQLICPDECDIKWGDDHVCNLQDFIDAYSEKFIKDFCNILDSFVGDDIDCYLEEDM